MPITDDPVYKNLEITQIGLWCQHQQGLIHEFDGLFNIIFMQHFYRGVHIA